MYKGNDEDHKDGMAHYHDLRELYAKHMEYHGCGFGLFQPVSARDMTPPCAGYFDRNGDWNLICNLSTSPQAQRPLHWPGDKPAPPFVPLKYNPSQVSQMYIEWQPKTSQNVEAHILSGGGQTPDNLPAGADVQIQYSSHSKFGAVLMTLRPITLHAYNDERLFSDWLNNNRSLLFDTYGWELKKYGLWIVTRTHSAPGCSINAWQDNAKQSLVSLKAKASMLGELADGQMQWTDKAADKDWSHYKAAEGDALVVFMDGLEVSKSEWYLESVRQKLHRRSPSQSSNRSSSPAPAQIVLPPQVGEPLVEQQRRLSRNLSVPSGPPNPMANMTANNMNTAQADIGVMPTWSENTAGATTHGGTQSTTQPRPRAQSVATAPEVGYTIGSPIQKKAARHDSGFEGLLNHLHVQPYNWNPSNVNTNAMDLEEPDPESHSPIDDGTLKDAGLHSLNRRSMSVRRNSGISSRAPSIAASVSPSLAPSEAPSSMTAMSGVSRAKSLRRETRSVSREALT